MGEYLEILKNIMAIFFYAILSSAILVHLIDWYSKKSRVAVVPDVIDTDGRMVFQAKKGRWVA